MPTQLSTSNGLVLWTLFFLICLGLGYPTLNRYDPGKIPGTIDAKDYCNDVRAPMGKDYYRVFVLWLAKPFYLLAKGRSLSWDPALFGMLMATSILTAGTAIVIIAIGLRCGFPYLTSLIAAMLFLLNWVVPNMNLAAYVDSGEAFFLALLTWCLLSNRWYLIPLWAVPGCFSKETFAAFSVLFVLIWWLLDRPRKASRIAWIAVLATLSCVAVLAEFYSPGQFFLPVMQYVAIQNVYARVGFFHALLRCLTAREFWFVFIWLMPLGLVRIGHMDRRWVWATSGALLLALLLGAYNDALGNTARAFFNISGPLLSLSAADLLTRFSRFPAQTANSNNSFA
jgi:hypothetical protein